MKRILLFAAVLICPLLADAQPYTIVTCPGEDTKSQINVSWAVDSTVTDTYVIFTKLKDKNWKKGTKVFPVKEFCTVFDTIWSKNAAGENFNEDARFIKCGASLNGLKPRCDYQYVVVADKDTSEVRYFKTSGDKKWSACVISDIHNYPPLPKRREAAMAMIDRIEEFDPSIDFILHIGDVCAWGGSYSFWKELYSEPHFSQYMWAGVNGNHDNMSRKYQLSNQYFKYANYYPLNGYKGEEGFCYHFMYGDVLFIMLNNENMRSDEGLAAAQEWVRKVVAENPARYRVVCEHYQWFFAESGESSQYNRWKELFDELGIDLAIAGNNHIYARTNALYKDSQTDGTYGTVYLQLPSSDDERGMKAKDFVHNTDKIMFRWTEGEKTVGAVHLSVTPKEMTLTLLDRFGNKLDSVKVLSKKR